MSSGDRWDAAASGWAKHQKLLRQTSAPLAEWLVEAVVPQPGEVLLELAAGLGETGYLAAERLLPGGRLISTDNSEGMLSAARRRAEELAVPNVEHRQMNAEWIDLPVASVDAVICRWGYMLMDDPAAALRETRRVLRAGGRLALAVWDDIARNPWSAIPAALLCEQGLLEEPAAGGPSPFALGDSERLAELLRAAGFQDVVVEAIDLQMRSPSFGDYWEERLDIGRGFHDAVMSQPAEAIERLREELRARLEPFIQDDGSIVLPARTLAARSLA